MKYELCMSTIHCIGRLNHVVGVAETEADAKTWVGGGSSENLKGVGIPKDDPIVWCPVKHCHMKRQNPIRSYQVK